MVACCGDWYKVDVFVSSSVEADSLSHHFRRRRGNETGVATFGNSLRLCHPSIEAPGQKLRPFFPLVEILGESSRGPQV